MQAFFEAIDRYESYRSVAFEFAMDEIAARMATDPGWDLVRGASIQCGPINDQATYACARTPERASLQTPPRQHPPPMTDLLDRAVQIVRALTPEARDALARILLDLAGDEPSPLQLSPEDEASFDASFAEAERGAFASDEETRAIWAKHGL